MARRRLRTPVMTPRGVVPRTSLPIGLGFGRRRRANRAQDPDLATVMVNGPTDPVATNRDFVLIKRCTARLILAAGTGSINNVLISTMLPAGAVKEFRIQKVSVYGDDVNVAGNITLLDLTGDEASFTDYGTPGHLRPQVHVRPAWAVRQFWNDPATAKSFYTVGSDVLVAQVIVQLTLQVRFNDATANLRSPPKATRLLRGTGSEPSLHLEGQAGKPLTLSDRTLDLLRETRILRNQLRIAAREPTSEEEDEGYDVVDQTR